MNTTAEHKRVEQPLILVVEDSDEDFAAFHRAMTKLGLSYPVHRCVDGDDCLDYLHQTGRYIKSDAPRPSLILLDLNLPGTDGREVLEQLDNDPLLRNIPVVVVTTSINQEDVELCYRNGANSYVTKSYDWQRFEDTVRMILSYWFNTVLLPQGTGRLSESS